MGKLPIFSHLTDIGEIQKNSLFQTSLEPIEQHMKGSREMKRHLSALLLIIAIVVRDVDLGLQLVGFQILCPRIKH